MMIGWYWLLICLVLLKKWSSCLVNITSISNSLQCCVEAVVRSVATRWCCRVSAGSSIVILNYFLYLTKVWVFQKLHQVLDQVQVMRKCCDGVSRAALT